MRIRMSFSERSSRLKTSQTSCLLRPKTCDRLPLSILGFQHVGSTQFSPNWLKCEMQDAKCKTRNELSFQPPGIWQNSTWCLCPALRSETPPNVHLLTILGYSKNSLSVWRRVSVFLGRRHLSLSVLEETVQRGLDTHKLSYARLCCYASRSSWGAHYKCWWNGCKRQATIVSFNFNPLWFQ